MKVIFFNSSMPRSGSTLMQNILGNNPKIYATPTSPLLELLNASRRVYTNSPTVKAQDEKAMRDAFIYFSVNAMGGFFEGVTDKPYVIDKSRGWALNIPYLESMYANPKIIYMVRDLRDIVASMEKNYRRFPEKWHSSLEDVNPVGITQAERITHWLAPNSKPVGYTLQSLREVINRGWADKILFVKFEDLCSNPALVMKKVYKYLELPYCAIDYKNVQQVTHEDDKFHGRYGDHIIKNKIEPVPSKAQELLGGFVCDEIYQRNKWYFDFFGYQK